MPYQITVPGRAVVTFPDSVTPEKAQSLLAEQFPPTGEDIAATVSQDPTFKPTRNQYALFEQFKDQQSTDYLSGLAQALPQVVEDIGQGIPGAARALLSADKSLAATGVEGFAQGTRSLYGLIAQSDNPSSPLFKFKSLLTGSGTLDERYNQFLEARDFAEKTRQLDEGNQTLIAKKDQIDPAATKALSYVLDPTLFFGPVKGFALAGHLGETALNAAKAVERVEGAAGKIGLKTAELAGTGAQKVGAGVGDVGRLFGKAVDEVVDFTGIPKEQSRTLLGGAIGAGVLSSPDVLSGIAATALGGGLLNRGGEVIAEAARIAQEGIPSRLGTLERVALSPTVSEPARKFARVLAQAQPVYRFVGDVAQGAAEGAAIGSTLGYLSTGTAEGAGAGAGAGIGLGSIGGGIGSFINIGARRQEGALGDITRFLDTIPDPTLKQRLTDGLARVAGEDQNYRRAAATVDAVNSARERGIGVNFLDANDLATAYYDPKNNTINLNPDRLNSGSAIHELDHAIRVGIIGKSYSEGLRETILGVKDQNGSTVKPGITDLNGLADVASSIAEQYKSNPAEADRFKQFSKTLKSDIPENDKAEAIGSVIDELTAIYTEKLFTRKGMEDALTKRLPLFYRNLVDSVTQRVYDKFRTNLYERGTPIPVGNQIKYAFTDDKGRLIRIPELDTLIENAMNAQYGSETAKPRSEAEIAKEQIKGIKEYQTLAKAKTAEEIAVQKDIQNAQKIEIEKKKSEILSIKNKQDELRIHGENTRNDLIQQKTNQNQIKAENIKKRNDLLSQLAKAKDEKTKQQIRSEIAKAEKEAYKANSEIAKAEKSIWNVEKEIAKAKKESAKAEVELIKQKKAEDTLAKAKASLEKAAKPIEAKAAETPLTEAIKELDMSHRFTKDKDGNYVEKPALEVEKLGKKFNEEAIARIAAVSKPGDPTLTEVVIGRGKGLSLKGLNENQILAFINTPDLPERAKTQIYNDWKNLNQDKTKGNVQSTVNYRINEEPYGSAKTIKEKTAQKIEGEHLVHDIVLTPKKGVIQRTVNTTRVKDTLARLIHQDNYKGIYNTPSEAYGDLMRYLNNLTLGEGKARLSAELFGGGSKGEKIRNMMHEAMGFMGDAPERPAGYDYTKANVKGSLKGQGAKHEDFNYYHIVSSTPTGEKWSYTVGETYGLGKKNFQPQDFKVENVGESKVYNNALGYRIIERDGKYTAYGKDNQKLGTSTDFGSATKQLITQDNKEYATNQRLLAKEYEQEYLNRNETRKTSETSGSNRLLSSKEGSQSSGEIGQVRQEGNVKFSKPPSESEAKNALYETKRPFFGEHRNLPEGTPVGVRIDIPAFLQKGVYVQTIHNQATPGNVGDRIGYDTHVRLKNGVRFFVKEGSSEMSQGAVSIKEGRAKKHPIATVEGPYSSDRSIPNDISTWTPVGMDPKKHSYFYDKTNGKPVLGGSESYSVGNTVFVKDPIYGNPTDFKYQPDPSVAGAFNFTNGFKALPGKAKGSFRIYSPTGGLVGIANGIQQAERMVSRNLK